MDVASAWRRHGRSWVVARPWLAAVAVAGAAVLAVLALADFEQQQPAQQSGGAEEPEPLEVPRGFPLPQAEDRAYYAAQASPVTSTPAGRVAVAWRFAAGLPADWRVAPGEGLPQPTLWRTNRGLAVQTTESDSGYQLVSAPRRVEPGHYLLSVDVGVVAGGVQLGVLDTAADRWLATRLYWSGQPGVEGRPLQVPFSLTYDTNVQIVLANWVREPRRSLWEIRRVAVAEAAPPAALTAQDRAFYRERAAPVLAPTLPIARTWSLADGLPSGWAAVGGAVLVATRGALDVTTGDGSAAYQLQSAALPLEPGAYEVVVRGTIADGGMQVGVLDLETNTRLATRMFWQGQESSVHVVPFTVDTARRAALVLSNASRVDRASAWRLSAVELRRADP